MIRGKTEHKALQEMKRQACLLVLQDKMSVDIRFLAVVYILELLGIEYSFSSQFLLTISSTCPKFYCSKSTKSFQNVSLQIAKSM